jgi:hypothetical protein
MSTVLAVAMIYRKRPAGALPEKARRERLEDGNCERKSIIMEPLY